MIRWLFAAVHLLALGIGLGAVWSRGMTLRGSLDGPAVRRVVAADTWWGMSAVLWIGTGLVRLLAGFEKGTGYYLHNRLFWIKMTLLALILVLEIAPIIALTRWRIALAKNGQPDTARAGPLATISFVEAALVMLMVFVATAMARGYGVPSIG